MAYTNVWSAANPPGSQAANTADDELRKLRLDIEERMATIVTGWGTAGATDPIVPRDVIKGDVVGKTLWYHHSAFEQDVAYDNVNLVNTFNRTALYMEHNAGDSNIRVAWLPLVLPVGVTITLVGVAVNRNGGTNMTCRFLSNTYIGTGPVVIGTASTIANGFANNVEPGGVPLVTVANTMYYVEVSFPLGTPSRLYGLRLVYNTPDCRITL